MINNRELFKRWVLFSFLEIVY